MGGDDDDKSTAELPITLVRPPQPPKGIGHDEVPCLTVLSGSQRGRVVLVPPGVSTIGRAPSALVQLVDDGVSRRHVEIGRTKEGSISVFDLGSTNGTYVNGTPVLRYVLREGDRVQIGSQVVLRFGYRLPDEVQAPPAETEAPPAPAPVAHTPVVELPLTPRELEVARLAAEALNNDEIGQRLHISPRTVKTHLRNVYQRLDVHSRVELARYLMKAGALQPVDEP